MTSRDFASDYKMVRWMGLQMLNDINAETTGCSSVSLQNWKRILDKHQNVVWFAVDSSLFYCSFFAFIYFYLQGCALENPWLKWQKHHAIKIWKEKTEVEQHIECTGDKQYYLDKRQTRVKGKLEKLKSVSRENPYRALTRDCKNQFLNQ